MAYLVPSFVIVKPVHVVFVHQVTTVWEALVILLNALQHVAALNNLQQVAALVHVQQVTIVQLAQHVMGHQKLMEITKDCMNALMIQLLKQLRQIDMFAYRVHQQDPL